MLIPISFTLNYLLNIRHHAEVLAEFRKLQQSTIQVAGNNTMHLRPEHETVTISYIKPWKAVNCSNNLCAHGHKAQLWSWVIRIFNLKATTQLNAWYHTPGSPKAYTFSSEYPEMPSLSCSPLESTETLDPCDLYPLNEALAQMYESAWLIWGPLTK
jgi:hypothetical protein